MARAHSFWLIVDGTVPTAFRARQREDLLPTLHQLQRTQPNVALLWFERGRTWESPKAAREALEIRRQTGRDRKPDWRPGGSHVDPRAKYKLTRDQKRERFKKRAAFNRSRPDERGPESGPRQESESPRPFRPESRRPPDRSDRPWRPRGTKGPANAAGRKGPWKPKGPRGAGGPRRPAGPRGPRGPRGPKTGR